MSPEALARNKPWKVPRRSNNPIQEQLQQVMLYESYVWMQIDSLQGHSSLQNLPRE
jgi:hypothetical protein